MLEEDRDALSAFAQCVRAQVGEARIWAFGSRARGEASWDSDLDLLVVVKALDRPRDLAIRRIAWEVGFERGFLVATVVVDEEQFERGPISESTLLVTIRREGIAA